MSSQFRYRDRPSQGAPRSEEDRVHAAAHLVPLGKGCLCSPPKFFVSFLRGSSTVWFHLPTLCLAGFYAMGPTCCFGHQGSGIFAGFYCASASLVTLLLHFRCASAAAVVSSIHCAQWTHISISFIALLHGRSCSSMIFSPHHDQSWKALAVAPSMVST